MIIKVTPQSAPLVHHYVAAKTTAAEVCRIRNDL